MTSRERGGSEWLKCPAVWRLPRAILLRNGPTLRCQSRSWSGPAEIGVLPLLEVGSARLAVAPKKAAATAARASDLRAIKFMGPNSTAGLSVGQ